MDKTEAPRCERGADQRRLGNQAPRNYRAVPGSSISPEQVQRILDRSKQHPGGTQTLNNIFEPVTGALASSVRILNASAGRVLLHPADAGSRLAVALSAAFERLGLEDRIGVSPREFWCAVPRRQRKCA